MITRVIMIMITMITKMDRGHGKDLIKISTVILLRLMNVNRDDDNDNLTNLMIK